MSTVRVQFHAVDIRAEGFETDDDGDYFDGAVNFDITVDGAVQRGLVARVKQAGGSAFADPLEVLRPVGYHGPFNCGRFRACVDRYARELVASQQASGRLPRTTNVRVRNVRLPADGACEFALVAGHA